MSRLLIAFAAALGALAAPLPAAAQQATTASATAPAPITRLPLQRFDIPGTGHETVIGLAIIAPSVAIGRHTHPGPESGYVIEGAFTLLIDGAAPRDLKAGESYVVPGGTIHDARSGPEGARVIATYIIEKGKPLASPAN